MAEKSRLNILMRKCAHMGKRNPMMDRDQILPVGRYSRRNNVCNFLSRWVKGFERGKGFNFPFSHRL